MATLFSDLQWKKAHASMTLTESGTAMLVKLSHSSKVFSEMLANDRGSVICFKALQPTKAPAPTTMTESGIITKIKTAPLLGHQLE